MMPENQVLFVGAGPGDPELITVAGRRALEQAQLVVYAGSLVSPQMLEWTPPDCRRLDSAGLDLPAMVEAMVEGHGQGLRVVRLHTGDPSLYGAVNEQFQALDTAGVPWRVIPGVSAAMAVAARLGLEYTLPGICQSLILTRAAGRTPVPPAESLEALAGHGTSLAIYLSAGQAQEVGRALTQAQGPGALVCVVQRVSWPDEVILWTTAADLVRDLAAAGIQRQALILAGPGVESVAPGQGRAPARSRLYDPGFSHGFRPARRQD